MLYCFCTLFMYKQRPSVQSETLMSSTFGVMPSLALNDPQPSQPVHQPLSPS